MTVNDSLVIQKGRSGGSLILFICVLVTISNCLFCAPQTASAAATTGKKIKKYGFDKINSARGRAKFIANHVKSADHNNLQDLPRELFSIKSYNGNELEDKFNRPEDLYLYLFKELGDSGYYPELYVLLPDYDESGHIPRLDAVRKLLCKESNGAALCALLRRARISGSQFYFLNDLVHGEWKDLMKDIQKKSPQWLQVNREDLIAALVMQTNDRRREEEIQRQKHPIVKKEVDQALKSLAQEKADYKTWLTYLQV